MRGTHKSCAFERHIPIIFSWAKRNKKSSFVTAGMAALKKKTCASLQASLILVHWIWHNWLVYASSKRRKTGGLAKV